MPPKAATRGRGAAQPPADRGGRGRGRGGRGAAQPPADRGGRGRGRGRGAHNASPSPQPGPVPDDEAQPVANPPEDAPAEVQPVAHAPEDAPAEAQPVGNPPEEAPADAQAVGNPSEEAPAEAQPVANPPEEAAAEAPPVANAPENAVAEAPPVANPTPDQDPNADPNTSYVIMGRANDFEQNAQRLAGYLGLPGTAALKQLIWGPGVRGIVETWYAGRIANFGMPGETETRRAKNAQVSMPGLMQFARDPLYSHALIQEAQIEADGLIVERNLPSLRWINAMHRVLLARPTIFRPLPNGTFSYEDYHRVYWLLRWYHKLTRARRLDPNKPVIDYSAEVPEYRPVGEGEMEAPIGPVGSVGANDEASLQQDLKEDALTVYMRQQQFGLGDGDEEEDLGADDKDNFDIAGDAIESTFVNDGSVKDSYRPKIERASAAKTLRVLSRAIEVLHDQTEGQSQQHSSTVSHAEALHALEAPEEGTLANAGQTNDDEAKEKHREAFFALQARLNQTESRAPSYVDACATLNLDADSPVMTVAPHLRRRVTTAPSPLEFQPWQVVGVAWILAQEQCPIKGGILADDCGLGKTVQTLASIVYGAARHPDGFGNHRPTLILVPPSVIDTWIQEWRTYFSDSILLRLFHGTHGKDEVRKALVVNENELRTFLLNLDRRDPLTSTVVVLSSYQTFCAPSLIEVGSAASNEDDDSDENDDDPSGTDNPRNAFPDSDIGDSDAPAKPKSLRSGLRSAGAPMRPPTRRTMQTSKWKGMFHRVCCDEGHKLKNPSSKTNISVRRLRSPHVWFMTATPMINKPDDLEGYLTALWNAEWRLDRRWASPIAPYEHVDTHAPLEDRLYMLDPDLFHFLSTSGNNPSTHAFRAFPQIFALIQIRRTMSSVLPVGGGRPDVCPGDTIPHYMITTVELKLNQHEQREHNRYYSKYINRLKRKGGKKTSIVQLLDPGNAEGRFDNRAYRRLCHLAYSPSLERFARSSRHNLVADVNRFHEYDDHGLTWFILSSRQDYAMPAPRLRGDAAAYLAYSCPKLRYLSKLLLDIVVQGKRRLLVFAAWPMVAWHIEMWLLCLGFKTVSLRSGHTDEEKTRSIQRFNDPDDDVEILVSTYQTCSLGINLHKQCSDMVMMQPAINANTALQAIGRVHRLGQRSVQHVYILFNDFTFDRYVEYRQAMKMITQIEGLGPRAYPEIQTTWEELQTAIQAPDDDEDDEAIGKLEEKLRRKLRHIADGLYRQMMGQCRTRLKWSDPVGLDEDEDSESDGEETDNPGGGPPDGPDGGNPPGGPGGDDPPGGSDGDDPPGGPGGDDPPGGPGGDEPPGGPGGGPPPGGPGGGPPPKGPGKGGPSKGPGKGGPPKKPEKKPPKGPGKGKPPPKPAKARSSTKRIVTADLAAESGKTKESERASDAPSTGHRLASLLKGLPYMDWTTSDSASSPAGGKNNETSDKELLSPVGKSGGRPPTGSVGPSSLGLDGSSDLYPHDSPKRRKRKRAISHLEDLEYHDVPKTRHSSDADDTDSGLDDERQLSRRHPTAVQRSSGASPAGRLARKRAAAPTAEETQSNVPQVEGSFREGKKRRVR